MLSPIEPNFWPPELDHMRAGFAASLNVYKVMAHNPALLLAWENFRNHCVKDSTLTAEQSEVVILRSGFNLGSSYEWNQHVYRARNIGMNDARILTLKGPLEQMAPQDALLAQAVDQLMHAHKITASLQVQIVQELEEKALLDIMATVAHYSLLGFLLNSFDVPLDNDIAQSLAANPIG